MPEPLSCASCGPQVPAGLLVLHPDLDRVAVPLCRFRGLHGATDADRDDVVQLDTPEAAVVLETYAVATGYVVSRARR